MKDDEAAIVGGSREVVSIKLFTIGQVIKGYLRLEPHDRLIWRQWYIFFYYKLLLIVLYVSGKSFYDL